MGHCPQGLSPSGQVIGGWLLREKLISSAHLLTASSQAPRYRYWK